MDKSTYTAENLALASWVWIHIEDNPINTITTSGSAPTVSGFAPLRPLRLWLDRLNIQEPHLAHFLCQVIPAQCPFERHIQFRGRTLLHIPPLCKLNPLYDEVVGLRFRALCYLSEVCGEDISRYC